MYDDIFIRFLKLCPAKQRHLINYMTYLIDVEDKFNIKMTSSYIRAMHVEDMKVRIRKECH